MTRAICFYKISKQENGANKIEIDCILMTQWPVEGLKKSPHKETLLCSNQWLISLPNVLSSLHYAR